MCVLCQCLASLCCCHSPVVCIESDQMVTLLSSTVADVLHTAVPPPVLLPPVLPPHLCCRLEEGWLDRLLFQVKADTGLLESCHVRSSMVFYGRGGRGGGRAAVAGWVFAGLSARVMSDRSCLCQTHFLNHASPPLTHYRLLLLPACRLACARALQLHT